MLFKIPTNNLLYITNILVSLFVCLFVLGGGGGGGIREIDQEAKWPGTKGFS